MPSDGPLIVYVNHPSWWDPLVAHYLNRVLFPDRQFYAPIDGDALQQYRVFAKLGFYGVQSNTRRGAGDFLTISRNILAARNTALWLTPEGRFADARDHSAEMMPGLSHLCSALQQCAILPIAIEYVFWDERLPVCLVRQGQPIYADACTVQTKTQWNDLLQQRLRETQTELSQQAIARSSKPFDDLLLGKQGAGGVYDLLRRGKSWLTGKQFQAAHGDQFSEPPQDAGN